MKTINVNKTLMPKTTDVNTTKKEVKIIMYVQNV